MLEHRRGLGRVEAIGISAGLIAVDRVGHDAVGDRVHALVDLVVHGVLVGRHVQGDAQVLAVGAGRIAEGLVGHVVADEVDIHARVL